MDRPILVFLGISYGLSVALGLIVGLSGGPQSPFINLGIAAMLFPAIAVLVVRLTMNERVASFGWGRFQPAYLLTALLLMPVVMHLVMLPTTAAMASGIPWQDWLKPHADGLFHAEARGWGALSVTGLAGRLALNAVIGLAVVSLLAFFEEIGWRAWLLPRLVGHLGWRRGIVAGAVLWALWHTPFALSGIHALEGVSAVTTALILPVGHIGAGLIIGWLWMKSQSIWVVMLAHGTLNNWGQYAFKFMQDIGPDAAIVLLLGNLGLLTTGSLIVLRGDRDAPARRDGSLFPRRR